LRPTGVYVATANFLKTCQALSESQKSGEIKDQDVRKVMAEINLITFGLDLEAEILDIGNPGGYRYARSLLDTPGMEWNYD